MTISRTFDGKVVRMTEAQAAVLDTLAETRKGGMAVIHGYSPDAKGQKYNKRPIYDATIISRVRVDRLYDRCVKALENITFDMLDFSSVERLAGLPTEKLEAMFDERLAFLLARYRNERENAHTVAHVRNYISPAQGIKGNLVTEPQIVDGRRLQIPVENDDGSFTLNSILVEGLLVNRRMISKGESKPTNPQNKTLVMRQIENLLPKVSSDYRRFSLSPETFQSVSIDRQTVFPDADLIAS